MRTVLAATWSLSMLLLLSRPLLAATSSTDSTFVPSHSVGIGLLTAAASSPLLAFDGANGVGLAVTLESNLGRRFVWDLRLGGFDCALGSPDAIFYPADDGDWSIGSSALRMQLGRTGNGRWSAGPEISLHYAQMEHFDYVGSGIGVGPVIAVDAPAANERLVTRIGAHLSWVWLQTDFEEPARPSLVAHAGIDLLWRFGRRGSRVSAR